MKLTHRHHGHTGRTREAVLRTGCCTLLLIMGMAATVSAQEPAAPENEPSLETLMARGAELRRARDFDGAVAVYERVLKRDPQQALAANLLSMVLLRAADSATCSQQVAYLQRARELAPESVIHRDRLLEALIACDRDRELARLYKDLPSDYPLSVALQGRIADALREGGQLNEARALYERVRQQAPHDPRATLGIALMLIDAGEHDRALTELGPTLIEHPDRIALLMARAAAYWQRGTKVLALDTFDHILELDPRHADTLNLKAQLLVDLGCTSLAHELMQAHADIMRPSVKTYVTERMAMARATWTAEDGAGPTNAPQVAFEPNALLALCYHDVPLRAEADAAQVTPRDVFVRHIEYLRSHGYRFISLRDIDLARRGGRDLPANPVLLTFDHGYASFMTNVLPVLEVYSIPAVLSVNPAWIDRGAPPELAGKLLNWEQLAGLSGHRLVTFGTHGVGLYSLVQRNPQGDMASAVTSRRFTAETGAYETEGAYRERIRKALTDSVEMLRKRLGRGPAVVTWPHGARSGTADAIATELGFTLQLGRGTLTPRTDTRRLERIKVSGQADILAFIRSIKALPPPVTPRHFAKVSHEALQPDKVRGLDERTDAIAARLTTLGIERVILAGCADANQDKNPEATYFPSRLLPVKRDTLDHIVARFQNAGLEVYVELPVLSLALPATARRDSMLALERWAGRTRQPLSPQKRLSPFHPSALRMMTGFYRTFARHVHCDGIVLSDDAYLTEAEDFNPAAQRALAELLKEDPMTVSLQGENARRWTDLKTRTLTSFTTALIDAARTANPRLRSMRTIFAPVLYRPELDRTLAQSYTNALAHADAVLVPAFVEMVGIRREGPWLDRLVDAAADTRGGLANTYFMVQTFDWKRNRWVDTDDVMDRLRRLNRAGAVHVGYSPDHAGHDRPEMKSLQRVLAEHP